MRCDSRMPPETSNTCSLHEHCFYEIIFVKNWQFYLATSGYDYVMRRAKPMTAVIHITLKKNLNSDLMEKTNPHYARQLILPRRAGNANLSGLSWLAKQQDFAKISTGSFFIQLKKYDTMPLAEKSYSLRLKYRIAGFKWTWIIKGIWQIWQRCGMSGLLEGSSISNFLSLFNQSKTGTRAWLKQHLGISRSFTSKSLIMMIPYYIARCTLSLR